MFRRYVQLLNRVNFTATNLKLRRERQIFKLRNTEHLLGEELYSIKAEIEHLTEQLQVTKFLNWHRYSLKCFRILFFTSNFNKQFFLYFL